MRKTYRVLADIIAVLVVVQAAMMVWAIAGLFSWIDGGATLDKAVIEGWENEPPTFEGSIGHFIHLMSGTFLIPLIGLLLLLVSFFAKVPRGVVLAATVVGADRHPVPGRLLRRARHAVPRTRARSERLLTVRGGVGGRQGGQTGGGGAGDTSRGDVERPRDQATNPPPDQPGGGGTRAAATGLVLAAEPDAVGVLRDGHGVRRLRGWPEVRARARRRSRGRDERRRPGDRHRARGGRIGRPGRSAGKDPPRLRA